MGSGVPRIIREVSEYGLAEPEFIDMECALRIKYAKSINVSIATTKRLFAKLQVKGLINREGTNRKGKWVIIEK